MGVHPLEFHLIGIKGTGMSALATILKDLGYKVTGSDVEEDFFTQKKLIENEIEVFEFEISNIKPNKIYIASTCYGEENLEVREVFKKNFPFYYYHEFIEIFFKNKIGVSGTHGKTTTTSIVSKLFENEKITYLIGDGTGKGEKDYQYFIFEACEYKNNFLKYNYKYLIINNIDFDHPDFFSSIEDVLESFKKAAEKAECLIINYDDLNAKSLDHPNKFTFGLNKGADIKAEIIETKLNGYDIKVYINNRAYQYFLPFLGMHMIYNFLAALAVYYLNNLDLIEVQKLISTYKQPSRRMEEYIYHENLIIDDYAHHPKEIAACLSTIKQKYPNKEIIIIFQPHTYSRTLALEKEFREVFQGSNLYLVETFTSKREKKNPALEKKIFEIFEKPKRFKKRFLKGLKKEKNKIILFLGAGNLNKYIEGLLREM